jgi:hypothetical protein
MRVFLALLAAAAAALVAPAATAQAPSLQSGTVLEAAQRLRAGEYLWAPEVAPRGPVLMVVSLATQRAVIYRNGLPIGITTVSTGRPGYRTPTGVFTVLQKHVEHYSSLYNNAPMPFMQRLTWGGVALHGGQLPGYPASHGCIRLPQEFARLLFGVTELGMTVVVTDQPVVPRIAPAEALLGRSGGSPPAARDAVRCAGRPQIEPAARADRACLARDQCRRPPGGGASQRNCDRLVAGDDRRRDLPAVGLCAEQHRGRAAQLESGPFARPEPSGGGSPGRPDRRPRRIPPLGRIGSGRRNHGRRDRRFAPADAAAQRYRHPGRVRPVAGDSLSGLVMGVTIGYTPAPRNG